VLIPAHNEASKLSFTIETVKQAIEHARIRIPALRSRIIVAADGCSDSTAQVARRWGAEVLELNEQHGKWRALARLIEESGDFEWIVFADSGVVWERDFLVRILPFCGEEDVMGIAPAYVNQSGGFLESLFWYFERHLKEIEADAGGPVSMHGATVLYRKKEACQALHDIGIKENWLNDDVVLPLVMRALNPDKRIRYVSDVAVSDHPLAVDRKSKAKRELGRRKRMALGNIQWISGLYPRIWSSNHLVGVLALRRVFRLFWAYWGLTFVAVLALTGAQYLQATPRVWLAALIVVGSTGASVYFLTDALRKWFDAAWASLTAPYYLVFRRRALERAVWR
jgi:glycosyltransferase involved in cell wall biosynthesis